MTWIQIYICVYIYIYVHLHPSYVWAIHVSPRVPWQWHVQFARVSTQRDMTHPYVRHDSCIRATCHVHTTTWRILACVVTHVCVAHARVGNARVCHTDTCSRRCILQASARLPTNWHSRRACGQRKKETRQKRPTHITRLFPYRTPVDFCFRRCTTA